MHRNTPYSVYHKDLESPSSNQRSDANSKFRMPFKPGNLFTSKPNAEELKDLMDVLNRMLTSRRDDSLNPSLKTLLTEIPLLFEKIKDKKKALKQITSLVTLLNEKVADHDNLNATQIINQFVPVLTSLLHEKSESKQATPSSKRSTWNPFSYAYTQFTNMGTRRKWWGGTRRRRRTAFKARRLKR